MLSLLMNLNQKQKHGNVFSLYVSCTKNTCKTYVLFKQSIADDQSTLDNQNRKIKKWI